MKRHRIQAPLAAGRRAAGCDERVERIAGSWCQNKICSLELGDPFSPRLAALHEGANVRLVAMQTADAAKQMRKTLQIARLLKLPAAHDRRKPDDLRFRLAVPGDKVSQAVDYLLEGCGLGIDTAAIGRSEHDIGDRVDPIFDNLAHWTLRLSKNLPILSLSRCSEHL